MCGFIGEYSLGGELTEMKDFEQLLALSKHRGPDSSNTVRRDNFQLGFNRLALLDLSEAGQQPKQSESGQFHLVFNGEVYNYSELTEQFNLQGLRSSSDTEVILHLLDMIGVVETLKQLNGMFAIAVIDTFENKLFLSRDFAGIKPLFYGNNEKGIVFASQFDQIFRHDWFSDHHKLRVDTVREYFSFGYMQAPNTVFENIFQVNPGECLVFDASGELTFIEILKFSKMFEAAKSPNKLPEELHHSVELQLHADRSLATFLSGGVDSSLISAMAKSSNENIEAFTIKVEDKQLNEAEFAKTYATHLKLKHQIKTITPDEVLQEVDHHFDSFSEPFGDYSSLPTYMVTREAVKYHTAMLSGDGGDELFFGYPRMYDILRKRNWFRLPYWLRTTLVRVTNKLKLTNTYAPFANDLEQFWISKQTKLSSALMDQSFGSTKVSNEMSELYRMNLNWDKPQLQHFLRWNEFYAHLQRVLIKVDRTSMKNSLEVRVPLLDKNVIEEAWKHCHDISNLSNLKKPLKDLVFQHIPKEMMMQEKKGFSVPIKDWLRTSLKEDVLKTVCDTPFYGEKDFNANPLISHVKDFLVGKHDNEWGVWHIYAWQKWAIKQKLVS